MGIPRLIAHLQPYAARKPLQNVEAIIDGPAFAHHILDLCMKQTSRSSPLENPSYEYLGRTAIEWLDELQAYGIRVYNAVLNPICHHTLIFFPRTVIYFDGFLPRLKRPERLRRLILVSNQLQNYRLAYVDGVPKGRLNLPIDPPVDLFPSSVPQECKLTPPRPPFLVPAIIEALGASKYGPMTKVMPGEADSYCAWHAKAHGGVIITGDSDLVVHDLGRDGFVVFFVDIHKVPTSGMLVALQYRPGSLCDNLSLSRDDLPSLAFEVNAEPHGSLEQAVARTKAKKAVKTNAAAYAQFMEPYWNPETGYYAPGEEALNLDPRVSEFVLCSSDESTDSASSHVCPDVWLPSLLDSPVRTSAWEASKGLRTLAYSLLRSNTGRSHASVTEFRRLSFGSQGRLIELFDTDLADSLCHDFNKLLSSIKEVVKPNWIWLTLSIYLDIELTVNQEKDQALSLRILGQEEEGQLDICSWDAIHVLAQIQATYYSLRMLRQILDFSNVRGGLPPVMQSLWKTLSSLPSLAGFPSMRDFADLIRQFRHQGAFSSLGTICLGSEDMLALLKAVPSQVARMNEKATRRTKNKRKVSRVSTRQPRSNNPFEILALE